MGQFRISVANLATSVQMKGQAWWFGMPNPKKLEAGNWIYQGLGGGAELTEAGKLELEKRFGASNFEKDDRTGVYDARFLVEENMLEAALGFFGDIAGRPNAYELDPTNDIRGELSGKEFPKLGTILSDSEMEGVQIKYMDTVRQKVPDDGVGTSTRAADAAAPTRRLFRRYQIVLPSPLEKKFFSSPIVRVFHEDEIASTNGGANKGKTRDGRDIADNLFP